MVLTEFVVNVIGWSPDQVGHYINTRQGCAALQSIYVQRNTWRVGFKTKINGDSEESTVTQATSRTKTDSGTTAPQNRKK